MSSLRPANSDLRRVSAVFHEAARLARPVIDRLLETSSDSLDWADDLRRFQGDYLKRSPQADLRACTAGCSACCFTVQVDVTPPEAIAVSDYLKTCLDSQSLEKIKTRLTKLTQLRRDEAQGKGVPRKLACGMLGEDGRCQVYPARPVVCSGVFSLDRQACETAAESVRRGDTSKSVPLDVVAIQATGGISGSLQRMLVERGLDGNLYELNSAVLCVLPECNALARYLAGEDLFRTAICTEAHSPPRKTHRLPRRILGGRGRQIA